jgi:hypothetical protein
MYPVCFFENAFVGFCQRYESPSVSLNSNTSCSGILFNMASFSCGSKRILFMTNAPKRKTDWFLLTRPSKLGNRKESCLSGKKETTSSYLWKQSIYKRNYSRPSPIIMEKNLSKSRNQSQGEETREG